MPHGAARPLVALGASGIAELQLVQEKGIHGQDAMSGRGQGPTGWVQAPVPRGHDAPEQAAQGAGAAQVGSPAGGTGSGPAGAGKGAGQMPPGQNPGTPVPEPLPGPAGIAPEAPAKQP